MVGKIGIVIAIVILGVFLLKGGDKITKRAFDKAKELKNKATSKLDTLQTQDERRKMGGQTG